MNTISVEELEKIDSSKITIVDVRPADQYSRGSFPGAVNIPLDEFEERMESVDREKMVYVLCHTGDRSRDCVEKLSDAGYEAVNIEGGYRAYLRLSLSRFMENDAKEQKELKTKEIEHSIIKTFRKTVWRPFTKALNQYQLIQEGDKIAVCISGGKDSMLMAKLLQELKRHGKIHFELVFLVMNPGYNADNWKIIQDNAELLGIPLTVFESDIFDTVAEIENNPCYLCARMRRGYLYSHAKELGCNNFVLFSNTPPVQYTYNGKGFSARGGLSNLKPEHYGDFAGYMADVAARYTGEGYHISHISPVNEPQYNWDSGQEGSGWTNDEVAALARELDMSLDDRGLSTDILLGESGDWEYLYKVKGDANRSNVFSAFFTPGSSAYVGDLAHVKNLICGHSYWTDGTWDGMRNVRKQVAQAAGQYNLDVWQSEWSMLGDNYSSSEFVGYEQASEMDIAFYMSKVIHNDLTVAGVSSWSYWTSMDVSRWGHKNRFLLISLVPAGGEYGDIEQEGSYQATATLWVLGNYSRFIRPGYRRIALDLNESRTFFGSAWLSPEGDKVVAVYTNMSDKAVRLGETHVGWSNEAKSIATYTTTGSKNLVEGTVAAGKQVILEAKSVTTVVYSLK